MPPSTRAHDALMKRLLEAGQVRRTREGFWRMTPQAIAEAGQRLDRAGAARTVLSLPAVRRKP